MRKVLAFVLLASAAAPALAAGGPGDIIRRNAAREASNDRTERPARSERAHAERGGDDGARAQPRVHVERSSGGPSGNAEPRARFGGAQAPHVESATVTTSGGGNDASEPRFHNGLPSRFSSGGRTHAAETSPQDEAAPVDSVRRMRGPKVVEAPQDLAASPTLRQPSSSTPRVFRNRVPVVSNTPHEGTQPPLRAESRRNGSNWASWSTSHWRKDRKYDWQNHRRRHRSLFHLGFYYDPFGWSYRPYQIGWRLWPSYYSSRYWLNDPWQYRLPYAPPGYRWIRYYDDALLVDTWDGRVVDVIYNFFW